MKLTDEEQSMFIANAVRPGDATYEVDGEVIVEVRTAPMPRDLFRAIASVMRETGGVYLPEVKTWFLPEQRLAEFRERASKDAEIRKLIGQSNSQQARVDKLRAQVLGNRPILD